MASWGFYEPIRRQRQAAEEQCNPQPRKPVYARVTMEWREAEQEKARLTADPAPVPHTPPDIE